MSWISVPVVGARLKNTPGAGPDNEALKRAQ